LDDNFEDIVENAATEACSTGWNVGTSMPFFVLWCITEEHERNSPSSQVATRPSKCLLTYSPQPGIQLCADDMSICLIFLSNRYLKLYIRLITVGGVLYVSNGGGGELITDVYLKSQFLHHRGQRSRQLKKLSSYHCTVWENNW
jgi:hypothetical protein